MEMKKPAGILFVLSIILLSLNGCQSIKMKLQSQFDPPPVAGKNPTELVKHGDTRIDNYYWLNQRDNPEVIDYLNAENDYLKSVMASTEDFQQVLYDELVSRIKQDDESVPYLDNGYYYYTKYVEGGEYPIYCRKKGSLEEIEEIMLDVNEMAKGYAYYQVGGLTVSPDNKLVAYGVDTVSRRKYTIYVKNLETGTVYEDQISETTGGVAWGNDNKTFFFTRKDPVTLRSEKIFRHTLGQSPSEDELVYFEEDETFSVGVGRTKSGSFIVIGSFSTLSSESWVLNADFPTGRFQLIQARQDNLEYSVDHFGDHFYIRTNQDASNFKLVKTPMNSPSIENWIDVIAHREDVLFEGFELFLNYLVLQERKEGLPQIRLINQTSGEDVYLPFDEEAYTASVSVNRDFNTDLLRYTYSSLTTPTSTFDYNMKTGEKTLLKQDEVVGGYSSDDYFTERQWAKAQDGTMIPMSIVYKKGLEKNGKNPCLLYAYGSYGISMSPYFSSIRLSLLDRGFVYAIAHIRGGQEMGRQWYEDGKLLKKKNTFTDFNDCAEFLIENSYTNSKKLFAKGGSAGGLLMGAIVNMRPDLYQGVIANVPFVDVITTMLDESIPLTTSEYDEWGNPNDPEYYAYMLSYSPYDNVEAKDYPAMLVTTGLHDSQVQYFEPAKWVAKLRDMKTDDHILIMDIDMEAGHGGASGRFKRYEVVALEYAFIFDQLGIHN
jgi:oligopeptidase B